MKIINHGIHKFDQHLPIYNWYFPLHSHIVQTFDAAQSSAFFEHLDTSTVNSRALYFHIPFCETICSFCPFVRTTFSDYDLVEKYTQALIKEIKLKAQHSSISSVPVGAIFFGGGTPSVLSASQLRHIGKTIRDHFDLSLMTEFSFECEVKSITPEKLEALQEIGVTHARFGLQTFNPIYREYFTLTATLDQVYRAIEILPSYFPYTSFDILYGMNGQTDEDFAMDIQKAIATGIRNIDFYPINNVVTQLKLHKTFKNAQLPATSGFRKFVMNIMLREFMRASGYLPHNGHGYVKSSEEKVACNPVTTDEYTFRYHEYIYGYKDVELIGFGNNAISKFNRYSVQNVSSRKRYISSLLRNEHWEFQVGEHDARLDESKGIILRLPYHGYVDKNRINWSEVHPDTLEALLSLLDAGLVRDTEERFELTEIGWLWYVNVMYFLSPQEERQAIDRIVADRQSQPGRAIETDTISIV